MQKIKKRNVIGAAILISGTVLFASGFAFAQTGPTISNISVTPSSTSAAISWTSDQPAAAAVRYGTSTAYTNMAGTTSTTSSLSMNQLVDLFGLTPSTTYHFAAFSTNASGTTSSSSDQMFTTFAMPVIQTTSTTSTTPTSTVTSSDLAALQNELAQLRTSIENLIDEVRNFIAGGGFATTTQPMPPSNQTSTQTSTMGFPPSNMSATIDIVGPVRAGTSVDFGGRNWAPNENVQVTNNGNVVATGRADMGGNFSTGSIPVTSVPGQQTYTFTGLSSGITRTVTVTITP